MACRRGQCAGIPLCNANVACVGFEAGVGEGCTGLAIGQSRLQINATGELEVCSNVAGVCSCEAVCTDCNTVLSDNDCLNGGVGAAYMLREATLASGVLTINGAPEHATVADWALNDVSFPGTPLGAGVQAIILVSAEVIITNPSLCRDMEVIVTASGFGTVKNTAAGQHTVVGIRVFIDGGLITGNGDYTHFPNTAGDSEGGSTSVTVTDTIPGGGSKTYKSSLRLENNNWVSGLGGFAESSGAAKIAALGSTV